MQAKLVEKLCKINSKLGISLVVLTISIVILLILLTTTVISTINAIEISKLTSFAKNLNSIHEASESYYISNNVMPILNDYTDINKDELISISRNSNLLIEELTQNGDLDSKFYLVNLAKINITQTSYGNKKLGEGDAFFISYPSMNVYYPYGLDVKDTTYYSITSKITSTTKFNQIENPISTVALLYRIKVSQANGWVNEMDVNIEVCMEESDELYMSVSGGTNRLITTTVGRNSFKFNLLSSIVNNSETIKVPTLTLEEANYIELGEKPIEERYVNILKYRNGKILDKVKIDLSNFSKIPPTIKSVVLSSKSTANVLNLSVQDSNSGIAEVRYEYLTKYTNSGTIEGYYENVTDFDSKYMKEKAKKTKLENDLTTVINAPKNVQSIKVAIIDKANNVSLYNQEIAPRLYIGYAIDISTKETLQLTAKVNSQNGIKTISFSKSLDGTNFTDEQVYTLDNTINGTTTKQSMAYKNILQDTVYIKIVAVNYDGSLTESRIINVNLADLVWTWDNPKIPFGFSKSTVVGETDVSTGLVIKDNTNGNEFVWIPIKDFNKFVRVEYNKGQTVTSASEATWDGISTTTELDKIYKSVKSNGGFYIARYEAGIDGVTTITTKDHKTLQDGSVKPVSKAGRGTWNFIKWGTLNNITNPGNGAITVARSMYNTSDIASNLIYGVQWDAALEFIKTVDSTYPINSTNKGNYTNKLALTGSSLSYKINNIYDMAGNEYEWTMEAYNTNYIYRGGCYGLRPQDYPSSYRNFGAINRQNANLGFRCALYLK